MSERPSVISALTYPVAERLIGEARRRDLTLGATIELALTEGWFLNQDPPRRPAPRATVISALSPRIADRLILEARRRGLIVGATLELALTEGWFMTPRLVPEREPA